MLADFGIARWIGEPSALTGTNMTVGTLAYSAPEQLKGEEIDGRADQYALAATAFQLLTGAPPFQHSNPAVVISQHLTADPPKIGSATTRVVRPRAGFRQGARVARRSVRPVSRLARALAHHIGAGGQELGARRVRPSRDRTAACRQQAKPQRRIIVPAAIALVRDRRRRSRFRALRPMRDHSAEASRRRQPRPPPSQHHGAASLCRRGSRRQLCDARRGGYHRRRRASVLRTPADDERHDLVAVSGKISSPTATAGPNDRCTRRKRSHRTGVHGADGQTHVDCHDDILQSNARASATPPS